jgi:hypothetical protein
MLVEENATVTLTIMPPAPYALVLPNILFRIRGDGYRAIVGLISRRQIHSAAADL